MNVRFDRISPFCPLALIAYSTVAVKPTKPPKPKSTLRDQPLAAVSHGNAVTEQRENKVNIRSVSII